MDGIGVTGKLSCCCCCCCWKLQSEVLFKVFCILTEYCLLKLFGLTTSDLFILGLFFELPCMLFSDAKELKFGSSFCLYNNSVVIILEPSSLIDIGDGIILFSEEP